MRGLEVLRDNFARLNAVAAAAGEPIALKGYASAAVREYVPAKDRLGEQLREDVLGTTADPVDHYNFACDGGTSLAVADVRVYHKCHEVSLRVVNGKQTLAQDRQPLSTAHGSSAGCQFHHRHHRHRRPPTIVHVRSRNNAVNPIRMEAAICASPRKLQCP